MPRREIAGGMIKGWTDRKRPEQLEFKDLQERTFFATTPITELEGRITPTEYYYVVNQLGAPELIHPDEWRLAISGVTDRSIKLELADLKKLPSRTVRAVTECAGNDMLFFDYLEKGGHKPSLLGPKRGGKGLEAIPVTGMVSAGEFTGVSLRDVLALAGVRPEAVAVRLQGADRGRPDPALVWGSAGDKSIEVEDPGVINYDKGLPIAKAMDIDTILAWSMNGEHLQHIHGGPVRAVVPGWSGNWWVKWLTQIDVMDHMPACYHQTQYFVLGTGPNDPNRVMCTSMGVKTLILDPLDEDSPLEQGSHAVRGLAWSGEGAITGVEVSADGGRTWHEAHVEESHDRWMWVRWTWVWDASKPGRYRLMARARDEHGRQQPQTKPNFQRKHFDGIVPTDIEIQ